MTLHETGAASTPVIRPGTVFRLAPFALLMLLTLGAWLTPTAAFSVDEAIYIEMARAMAENGSFAIASNGGVADAPTLLQRFTYDIGGRAYPQYPGGYGIIAAPFYALLGLRGLILLNALSTFAAVFATYRLARCLYDDVDLARIAAGLMIAATFITTYAFGIWPHMLALALVMIGAERLAAAAAKPSGVSALLLGGFSIGLAINLRTDVILFMFAGFLWLRLFAAPGQRSAALLFVVGLLPGLLSAAMINDLKFGVFSPIAYGPTGDEGVSGKYVGYVGIVAAFLAAALVVDASNTRFKPLLQAVQRRRGYVAIMGLSLLAIVISEQLRTWLWNVYVLVVDLEQLDDRQLIDGMFRMDNGFVYHWGAFKPALLQSIPFAVLSIVPLAGLLRGERSKEHSLSFAMIAAPIAFYALTQWHGGYTLSMRYFLPCVPFLCILAAWALRDVRSSTAQSDLRRGAIFGIALTCLGVLAFRDELSTGRLVFENYVPVLVAALLTASCALIVWKTATQRARRIHFGLAGAAIAWSVASSASDVVQLQSKLASHEQLTNALAAPLPTNSLVFTIMEEWMVAASAKNVHTYNPKTGNAEMEAARAFIDAGRCVYIHLDRTLEVFEMSPPLDLVVIEVDGVPAYASRLYQPEGQVDACSLS